MVDLLDEYDGIMREVDDMLPDPDKAEIDAKLTSMRTRIATTLSQRRQSEPMPMQSDETHHVRLARSLVHSGRYLGEVSDVRFFNLVRRMVLANGTPDANDEGPDSYEQDDPVPQRLLSEVSLELPSVEVAEEYIEIYFTTIHIAYPFIPKSTFWRIYRKLRESTSYDDVDISWLALLCEFHFRAVSMDLTKTDVVFAIGAYYTSFPAKAPSTVSLHEKYFRRAIALSNPEVIERSPIHVSFLLAQCFYLLMVCKTDR